jgi:hypothetical protein
LKTPTKDSVLASAQSKLKNQTVGLVIDEVGQSTRLYFRNNGATKKEGVRKRMKEEGEIHD